MPAPLTSRFDLSRVVWAALAEATRLRLIDAVDAVVLGATHGGDAAAILADLTETAFVNRHTPAGGETHAAMCRFNDQYHAETARETAARLAAARASA